MLFLTLVPCTSVFELEHNGTFFSLWTNGITKGTMMLKYHYSTKASNSWRRVSSRFVTAASIPTTGRNTSALELDLQRAELTGLPYLAFEEATSPLYVGDAHYTERSNQYIYRHWVVVRLPLIRASSFLNTCRKQPISPRVGFEVSCNPGKLLD